MAEPHNGAKSTEDQIRNLYEHVESQTAKALEELVAKPSFGRLLAITGENVAALARISSDAADLVLRNLRLASRADVARLARQLYRTEDKLERVLQEVEGLRDELASANTPQRDQLASGDTPQRNARREAVKRP
jgi:pantoate kinase